MRPLPLAPESSCRSPHLRPTLLVISPHSPQTPPHPRPSPPPASTLDRHRPRAERRSLAPQVSRPRQHDEAVVRAPRLRWARRVRPRRRQEVLAHVCRGHRVRHLLCFLVRRLRRRRLRRLRLSPSPSPSPSPAPSPPPSPSLYPSNSPHAHPFALPLSLPLPRCLLVRPSRSPPTSAPPPKLSRPHQPPKL